MESQKLICLLGKRNKMPSANKTKSFPLNINLSGKRWINCSMCDAVWKLQRKKSKEISQRKAKIYSDTASESILELNHIFLIVAFM